MALRWSKKHARASVDQITGSAPALFRPIARAILKRQIGATTVAQGLGRLPEEVVLCELAGRLDDLATILGDRRFFFADEPSVADLAVYGMLACGTSGPTPEINGLVGERPALVDWMSRVEQATTS
jgi:glutathione S-transferase